MEQGPDSSDRTPEGRGAEEPLLQGGPPQPRGLLARLKAAAKRLKRRMRVLYYASIVRPLTFALTYMAPQPVHGVGAPVINSDFYRRCTACCGQEDWRFSCCLYYQMITVALVISDAAILFHAGPSAALDIEGPC